MAADRPNRGPPPRQPIISAAASLPGGERHGHKLARLPLGNNLTSTAELVTLKETWVQYFKSTLIFLDFIVKHLCRSLL